MASPTAYVIGVVYPLMIGAPGACTVISTLAACAPLELLAVTSYIACAAATLGVPEIVHFYTRLAKRAQGGDSHLSDLWGTIGRDRQAVVHDNSGKWCRTAQHLA